MSVKIPDYPVLEFTAKRKEPDGKGGYEIKDAPFFMDLRGSNATLDHVLVYTSKGYTVEKFHNVSNELLLKNESWLKIHNFVVSVNRQADVVSKRKPIAELVEKVKGKIDG